MQSSDKSDMRVSDVYPKTIYVTGVRIGFREYGTYRMPVFSTRMKYTATVQCVHVL